MAYKVTVCGSGVKLPEGTESPRARAVGSELARRGAELYVGGCWGLSYEAAVAARKEGAKITVVSPGRDRGEHMERFDFPDPEQFSETVYFGRFVPPELQRSDSYCFMARSGAMVAMADKVVALRGTIGTFYEITAGLHEDKDVGVLLGEDGWDEYFRGVLERNELRRRMKKGKVIYEPDPQVLVTRILE